ncbi:hypothetical protein D3C78_1606720 [compost metagenome]
MIAGAAFSPIRFMLTPSAMANTMICRILPSAKAVTGLLGTRPTRICTSEGACLASLPALATMFMPSPGVNRAPKSRPMLTAKAVVTR